MWKGWGGGKLAGVSSLFPQLGWALNSGHQAWRQAPLLPAEPSCCPHLPGSKGVSARLLCFSMPEDLAEKPDSPTTCKSNRSKKLPWAWWRGKGYCSAGCCRCPREELGSPPLLQLWVPGWQRWHTRVSSCQSGQDTGALYELAGCTHG